jgi:molybdenum cofactor guanylyltransferase
MERLSLSVSTLILAGGHSRRMGQDKAMLLLEDEPLLTRLCQVALLCVPPVRVVTPWPERYQAILPNPVLLVHERASAEETESNGPLVGFAQGLRAVETNWVLLLACDLPCLGGENLRAWMVQLAHASEDAIAVLPRHEKGWEPLCGFYRRSCLENLNEFIAQGGRSFQRWLQQHPVEELVVPTPQVLWNCNTPSDWQAVIENQLSG